MKQYISKVLKVIAALLLVFPVFYVIFAAILFDIPLNRCLGILLSPFYYVVTSVAVIAGYGLWEMRRWSWYAFVAAEVLIFYENALLVHGYAETHHKLIAFLMAGVLQLFLFIRVAHEVRVPYFFPKIRWWESNPKYRLSVPVKIKKKSGTVLEGDILDLSMVGCFIKLRPSAEMNLESDERLSLQFTIFNVELECEGTIVWSAQSTVTHPKGVGVKFHLLSRNQKKSLRSIGRRLKKISSLYRRSRYLMSQEEFMKQMREIELEGSSEEISHGIR